MTHSSDNKFQDTVTSSDDSVDEIDSPFPPTPLQSGNPLLYRIILGALLSLGVFLVFYALNLGIGSLRQPASGLWILIVSALIVLSIPAAYFVKEQFEVFNRVGVFRATVMIGGLFLFVILYPLVGFLLAGAICLFIIARWSAGEGLRNSLLIAGLTPTVLYLLFGVAFSVSLDILPSWL